MSSAATRQPSENDLSARARIREAAIREFGSGGFGASVRAIAAAAGVSPGLVIHHFGSKDRLRAECDERVRAAVREAKSRTLVTSGPGDLIVQLASLDEYAPLAAYIVQALLAGGDLAATFFDHMVSDAEQYLQEAVEAGRVHPSRDPAARARFMARAGVGALLVYVRRHPPIDGDLAPTLRAYMAEIALPALELYTEGLLTDSSMLDDYLGYLSNPPVPHD